MSSESSATFWGWCIALVMHFIIAKSGGCSPDGGRFQAAVRSSGLTDPVKHGYDFFECGYGDVWVESFTAHLFRPSKSGSELVNITVNGTMCCGIFKGCTIRWP